MITFQCVRNIMEKYTRGEDVSPQELNDIKEYIERKKVLMLDKNLFKQAFLFYKLLCD